MHLAPLFIAGVIALGMAVVQHYALEYYWYWTYWWLDILMHGAGGVVIGLLAARYVSPRIIWILIVVLVVGVVWEVFEFVAGISLAEPNFLLDSSTDLVMDLLGGVVAYGMMRQWLKSPSPLTAAHDASPDQIS